MQETSATRWARDHNIRFLLFNPSKAVRKWIETCQIDLRVLHYSHDGRNDGPARLRQQPTRAERKTIVQALQTLFTNVADMENHGGRRLKQGMDSLVSVFHPA